MPGEAQVAILHGEGLKAGKIVMPSPFAAATSTCDKGPMRLHRFASLWIMLLVAAGLLLAPLAGPVLANPGSGPMDTASDMQAMADDMPCCPDQTSTKACADCPLFALCMLTISMPAPSGASAAIEPDRLLGVLALHDDQMTDGLAAKPPDHPPRSHV